MSSLIADPNDLVKQPHDKYWDGALTRREAQRAFTKLGNNDAELMAMCDTAALVVNFLCDKLNVTRAELDIYVEKKKQELAELKASQAAAESAEAANEQSNG